MQYKGGYFLHNEPLVRGYGFNAHTARDTTALSHYTVMAVNYLQETAWRTNNWILDVIDAVVEGGENLTTRKGDVVLMVAEPVNPRPGFKDMPDDYWKALDKTQRKALNAIRARALDTYEEELGSFRGTHRVIETAREMRSFDNFYYPHNLDFRTRIYPIPTDLTPQANDLSKGLLQFFRGTRLGAEGLYWLKVTVASHWGKDKLSMDARCDYSETMLTAGDIQTWVDDPLVNRGWLEADSPFQFLASAYELVWAMRHPYPEDFISHGCGNLDGSCNGAQHLAIMARSLRGATATNCRSIGSRMDLYMEVADKVWEIIQKQALEGDLLALEWSAKMSDPDARRKVVKRAVMTIPYGVTAQGVTQFMIDDKHVSSTSENEYSSAKYMQKLIMESVGEIMKEGRELQVWFATCAEICAKQGKPLIWDTPAGSKITQAYRNLVSERIETTNTKFIVYLEPEEDEDDEDFLTKVGIDIRKAATAAPPNVVHSCDASHLQITVCRMYDAGIRDFCFIHDSFGAPYAKVGLMRDILRQTAVDMYRDDYLQVWKKSVEHYSGLTMPEPPALGDFDVEEILNSEFFFS